MDDTTSWTRLSRLLDEVLDVAPEERDVWLNGLELHGEPLVPRLRALLAHEPAVRSAEFLESGPDLEAAFPRGPHSSDSPSMLRSDPSVRPGGLVGPYRLLEPIGEGGMGVVWRAERADGLIQRVVALKLPLGRWPRGDLVERFAREREILAALNHPNIARLYDAGVTADGRPYLALEYVEGRPIDAYCNEADLSVRSRVDVFLQVLHAVAYAHARLVVHRDLKPTNILVTHDGQVRLLDFGVAKLLENGQARRSALTELSGEPRTPEYASPEQIAEEPLGTASDVYSLGVVLYELLTGRRPYRVSRESVRAIETAVLEADADPPSKAAQDDAVGKVLRGDLDTIVLKALRKKSAERYATVDALADDLQNYLAGYPVRARADGAWYRFSRLVARNKLAAAATAVAFVSLAAFGAVSAWQARVLAGERRVAQTERDTAEQVVRVLIDLFETTNPSVRPDGDRLPIGEFLSSAQTRSLELLKSQPAVRARLLQVFGLIHQTRGQYSQARASLDEALAEQRRQRGADDPEALDTLQALGELAFGLNDNVRARRCSRNRWNVIGASSVNRTRAAPACCRRWPRSLPSTIWSEAASCCGERSRSGALR
jgi:serine/threonine-protein kinase